MQVYSKFSLIYLQETITQRDTERKKFPTLVMCDPPTDQCHQHSIATPAGLATDALPHTHQGRSGEDWTSGIPIKQDCK